MSQASCGLILLHALGFILHHQLHATAVGLKPRGHLYTSVVLCILFGMYVVRHMHLHADNVHAQFPGANHEDKQTPTRPVCVRVTLGVARGQPLGWLGTHLDCTIEGRLHPEGEVFPHLGE